MKEQDAQAKLSLKLQAYQYLKTKILNCEYRPNEFLNEQKLCAEMGNISRTPMRDALGRLEQEGLTLVEIAHGVDLQRDILDQMEFKPVIPEYVRYMDPRLFREGPMGLTPEQMEMLDPEYEFWRDLRPGGEGGESRG